MLDWNFKQLLSAETLGTALRCVVLLVIGMPGIFFLTRWLRGSVGKAFSPQQGMIASKLVLYVGMTVIVFSLLNEFGFKLTHLLAAAGVAGIAIGFAAQTSFSNIISGFFLMAEQPFVVDDLITVGNTTGVVMSIDMLSVRLRTFDNKMIRVPNEMLLKSDVTNITHFAIRRVDINIGVAYKENVQRIREILLDLARKNPYCLQEPEPVIIFSGFGNSSIDLFFGVWAEKAEFLKLKNTIQEEIKARFDEEGIEIPFPHVSLYKGSASEPLAIQIVNGGQKSKTGAKTNDIPADDPL